MFDEKHTIQGQINDDRHEHAFDRTFGKIEQNQAKCIRIFFPERKRQCIIDSNLWTGFYLYLSDYFNAILDKSYVIMPFVKFGKTSESEGGSSVNITKKYHWNTNPSKQQMCKILIFFIDFFYFVNMKEARNDETIIFSLIDAHRMKKIRLHCILTRFYRILGVMKEPWHIHCIHMIRSDAWEIKFHLALEIKNYNIKYIWLFSALKKLEWDQNRCAHQF